MSVSDVVELEQRRVRKVRVKTVAGIALAAALLPLLVFRAVSASEAAARAGYTLIALSFAATAVAIWLHYRWQDGGVPATDSRTYLAESIRRVDRHLLLLRATFLLCGVPVFAGGILIGAAGASRGYADSIVLGFAFVSAWIVAWFAAKRRQFRQLRAWHQRLAEALRALEG